MSSLLSREDFFREWSGLHGGAPITGATRWWLKNSYVSARIATALKFSPNALTAAGLIAAIAMALSNNTWLALALLALSLYFDGIDGSVAIIQRRASERGGVLDSIADRIAEALWLYASHRAGLPLWAALPLWAIASTQEYARARLASLGWREIGIVTICERPVRAIATAFILLASFISQSSINIVGIIYLTITLISFMQVMYYAKKTL